MRLRLARDVTRLRQSKSNNKENQVIYVNILIGVDVGANLNTAIFVSITHILTNPK